MRSRRRHSWLFGLVLLAANVASAVETRIVHLPEVGGVVFDRARNLLYASVEAYGQVVAIDPSSATVEVMDEDNSAARNILIDSAGTYLYVRRTHGFLGLDVVRRIELASGSVDLEFVLEEGPPVRPIVDWEVMPGHPGTIVVNYLAPEPREYLLAVYDEGVRRPNVVNFYGSITFGGSSERVYGHSRSDTDGGFYRFLVDDNGISIVDVTFGLLPLTTQQLNARPNFIFDSGLVYSGAGFVIDPEGRSLISTIGGLATGNSILPDSVGGRLYVLQNVGLDVYSVGGTLEQHARINSASYALNSGLLRLGESKLAYWWSDSITVPHAEVFLMDLLPCGELPLGCEEGNPCDGIATCADDQCNPGVPYECPDDGNVCNGREVCEPSTGMCYIEDWLGDCSDGNPCNGAERCDPELGCQSGVPPRCDDGDACNGLETCYSWGGCVEGIAPVCVESDGDACTRPACNRETGCVEEILQDATCWDLEGTVALEALVPEGRKETASYAAQLILNDDGTYRLAAGRCPIGEGDLPDELGSWIQGPRGKLALLQSNGDDVLRGMAICAGMQADWPSRAYADRRWAKIQTNGRRFCGRRPSSDGERLCGVLRQRSRFPGSAKLRAVTRFMGAPRS